MKKYLWDVLALAAAALLIWGVVSDALAESNFRKALELGEKGLHREAIFACYEALDYNNSRPQIHRTAAGAYLKYHESNESEYLLAGAAKHYNLAISLDPQYPYHYAGLGRALEEQANKGLLSPDHAYHAFNAAHDIDPYNPYFILQLIRMDIANQQIDTADKQIIEFINIDPRFFRFAIKYRFRSVEDFQDISYLMGSNPEYHLRFAHFLRDRKYRELAQAEYSLAADLFPAGDSRIVQSASYMIQIKKLQQAIPILESYLSVRPDDAKANFLLGLSYERTGRIDLAKIFLTKATNYDSQKGVYLVNLARVLEKTGDFPQAMAAYEKAFRLGKNPHAEARLKKLKQKMQQSR